MSAIDAERAFAADAQRTGQWTAFRKWSAPRAMMFVPAPTNAHQFLSPCKDPPQSVFWWPGRSYVSCDGNLAINTGPWVRGYGKTIGYFTTVWARQPDGGWKWVYDGGDELEFARDEGGDIKQVNASCATPAPPHPAVEHLAETRSRRMAAAETAACVISGRSHPTANANSTHGCGMARRCSR